MRFLVMVKFTEEPTVQGPTDAMGAFNKALIRDGVLLAAEGLQPTSKGVRITYQGGRPTVTDGPFAESKELVAGFWILQGRSKEEIVEVCCSARSKAANSLRFDRSPMMRK